MAKYNISHSESRASATAGGTTFCGFLTLLFIALKLLGIISWPWVFVLAPLWVPVSFVIVIFLIITILVIINDKDGD